MTILVVILLMQLVLVLVVACFLLRGIRRDIQANTSATDQLRLDSRTRISQVSVRSGAVTEEQQLRRLGRASVGRRIVVGGDRDSQQYQNLLTQEQREEDHG